MGGNELNMSPLETKVTTVARVESAKAELQGKKQRKPKGKITDFGRGCRTLYRDGLGALVEEFDNMDKTQFELTYKETCNTFLFKHSSNPVTRSKQFDQLAEHYNVVRLNRALWQFKRKVPRVQP